MKQYTKHELEMMIVGASLMLKIVEDQIDELSEQGLPPAIHTFVLALTTIPKEGYFALIRNFGHESDIIQEAQPKVQELATLLYDLWLADKEKEGHSDATLN
jgi:hypothetical protein